MRRIKKLLPIFLFIPFGAAAVLPPIVIGLIAGAIGTIGFSIYRSVAPVDLSGAFSFFSSCWSCDAFSGIIGNLSGFIPKLYDAIGATVIPIALGLTFVWFAWRIISDYINARTPDAWQITGSFGTHLIKLAIVGALLAFPLPKFMMDTFIQPIMNIGLSYNNVIRNRIQPGDDSFDTCMIATALGNPQDAATQAYSPKLMGSISCQIAEFHKMTGLGMTVGWTFLNMAFDVRYEWIPLILPNFLLIFAGFLVMLMFLWALLPVPLYFLEVFITLSLDLIMLPLMLLGWLFGGEKGWNIFPGGKGARGVKSIIDDVVKSTFGLALVGLFVGFALLFLNDVIGVMDGEDALTTALQTGASMYLMEGLKFNNDSIINILMAGLFIGMFMNAIPNLIKKLFAMDLTGDFKKAAEWKDNIAKFAENVKKGIDSKINPEKNPDGGAT